MIQTQKYLYYLVTRVYLKIVFFFCQVLSIPTPPPIAWWLRWQGVVWRGDGDHCVPSPAVPRSVRRRIVCAVIQCNPIQQHPDTRLQNCRYTPTTTSTSLPRQALFAGFVSTINIFKYDNNNFLAYLAAVVGWCSIMVDNAQCKYELITIHSESHLGPCLHTFHISHLNHHFTFHLHIAVSPSPHLSSYSNSYW